jgi:hypothetical protein
VTRVLVTGDRHWADPIVVDRALDAVHASQGIDVLIEGCATGADWLAGSHKPGYVKADPYTVLLRSEPAFAGGWAWTRGVAGIHFPAQWYDDEGRFRRWAGPERNGVQLTEGKPDIVVAFHPDLEHSRGTADMVRKAVKAGIQVRHFDGTGHLGLRMRTL